MTRSKMYFNGISKDYFEVAYDFVRPPLAWIDIQKRDIRRGGGRIYRNRLDVISIPIPFNLRWSRGVTYDEIAEDLAGWLYTSENKPLYLNGRDDRYYMAQLESLDVVEEHAYAAKGILYFISEDPYRFGADRTLEISAKLSNQEVLGQVSPYWESEAILIEDTSKYTVEIGSAFVELNYGFESGDVIRINSANRQATLNGDDLAAAINIKTEWNYGLLDVGKVKAHSSVETVVFYTERYY